MKLLKHGRSKKGLVAPMSDDEGHDRGAVSLQQADTRPRPVSRGVSFTTSRGRIWLILVINLCIITTFIFMSPARFPSLSGESVVSDAITQKQHPGPINKNADQIQAWMDNRPEATKDTEAPETTRPGAYTKITSEIYPGIAAEEQRHDLMNTAGLEMEVPKPDFLGDSIPHQIHPVVPTSDPPATLSEIHEKEHLKDSELRSTTTKAPVPALNTEPETANAPPSDEDLGHSSKAFSKPGQRSPAEIAEIIAKMKELQESTTTLPTTLDEVIESDPVPTVSAVASLQSEEPLKGLGTTVESQGFQGKLKVWLTAETGVEVESLARCLASSGNDVNACAVNSWTNQIASLNAAEATAFHTTPALQKPVWVPIAPDTHHQLPVVYFSCPMVSESLQLHESMTLFFVISPAQVETGNSYRGQKFFGNSPYGQFALHGGKPSFFANSGLDETNYVLPTGKFSLLVYRLHRNSVEIKVNDRRWSGGANVDENHIRFSANDAVSLGNVKSTCDSNAFQGRVAEILVYDAALDDAKVESVKTYLHDKWWGGKLFPTVAAITAAPAATSAPDTEAVATNSPTVAPIHKAPLEQTTVPLQQEQDPHQTSTTTKPIDDAAQEVATEDVAPAPKFDPRVNIFEWRPPLNAEQTKVAEWTKTVKEKVDFIRNFQLGGDVLRALIRQHHDELVSLRDGLFG